MGTLTGIPSTLRAFEHCCVIQTSPSSRAHQERNNSSIIKDWKRLRRGGKRKNKTETPSRNACLNLLPLPSPFLLPSLQHLTRMGGQLRESTLQSTIFLQQQTDPRSSKEAGFDPPKPPPHRNADFKTTTTTTKAEVQVQHT